MAGFSDTFENDLCKLIFNAVAVGNIADNAATAPLTALWCALHTADPADSGTQGVSEGGYAQYTRISVARTTDSSAVPSRHCQRYCRLPPR